MKRYRVKPGWNRFLGLPIAYEISAGAVVFRRLKGDDVETLLLKYPHVEAGETLEEAALREIEEETGLARVKIVSKFHYRVHYFYTAHGAEREKRLREKRSIRIFKTVHFFLAESLNDNVVQISDEHLGFAWLPFGIAESRVSFENAKRILRRAHEFFKKTS